MQITTSWNGSIDPTRVESLTLSDSGIHITMYSGEKIEISNQDVDEFNRLRKRINRECSRLRRGK